MLKHIRHHKTPVFKIRNDNFRMSRKEKNVFRIERGKGVSMHSENFTNYIHSVVSYTIHREASIKYLPSAYLFVTVCEHCECTQKHPQLDFITSVTHCNTLAVTYISDTLDEFCMNALNDTT